MRHRVYGKHLGRDKNQRTALFRGLVRSLFLQGSLTTTETKAKAIKGLVDRLVSKARENTNASRRVVESTLPQKEVSKKLFEEIAPSFKTRTSGFTETVRMGIRSGDGAMLVKMNLIEGDKVSRGEKVSQVPQGEEKEVEKKARGSRGTRKTRDTSKEETKQ